MGCSGEFRLGITTSQQLLLACSQERNDYRSQYLALSPLNQIINGFRFCVPPSCLKRTILERSTRNFSVSLFLVVQILIESEVSGKQFALTLHAEASSCQHFPHGSKSPGNEVSS